VILSGCQAQWGVAVRPPADDDPRAGEAHLGDAETTRLGDVRERLDVRLQRVDRRLAERYHDELADERLWISVALSEIDVLIEQRNERLRGGQTNVEREDVPDDEAALLARIAARVAQTRRRALPPSRSRGGPPAQHADDDVGQ
jgi:osmotically-inducible protein OsmY